MDNKKLMSTWEFSFTVSQERKIYSCITIISFGDSYTEILVKENILGNNTEESPKLTNIYITNKKYDVKLSLNRCIKI